MQLQYNQKDKLKINPKFNGYQIIILLGMSSFNKQHSYFKIHLSMFIPEVGIDVTGEIGVDSNKTKEE